MIDYSIDTNVFSQVFRGNAPVKSFVESLSAAIENDLTLITYNVDDFKFIQNLKWLKLPV